MIPAPLVIFQRHLVVIALSDEGMTPSETFDSVPRMYYFVDTFDCNGCTNVSAYNIHYILVCALTCVFVTSSRSSGHSNQPVGINTRSA